MSDPSHPRPSEPDLAALRELRDMHERLHELTWNECEVCGIIRAALRVPPLEGTPMADTAIVVNGRDVKVGVRTLTFDDLIRLAGGRPTDTVSVHYPKSDTGSRAPMCGEVVTVLSGMVVNVVDTSNA